MRQTRQYHWDTLRALFLLIGIPFHAAMAYSVNFDWSVASPERSLPLTMIAEAIRAFQMPGFFLIAGYFAMMALQRRDAVSFFRHRLVRLGVPLIAASLTILPVQMLIQSAAAVIGGQIAASEFWPSVLVSLTRFDEPWVSHLWFLYSLLLYCGVLAAFCFLLGQDRLFAVVRRGLEAAADHPRVLLAVLCGTCLALAVTLPILYETIHPQLKAVAGYLRDIPFFLLGMGLFVSASIRRRYEAIGMRGLLAGAALIALSLLHSPMAIITAALACGRLVGSFLIVGFLVSVAKQAFDRPDERVRKAVDASFTVYLFHHPIVMLLAMIFLGVDWPPSIEFAVIVTITAVLAFSVHGLIARHDRLLFLFNGVVGQGRPSVAVPGNPAPVSAETMRSGTHAGGSRPNLSLFADRALLRRPVRFR